MKTSPPKPSPQDCQKKAYTRPRLIVYGDIRELTRAETFAGAPDGKYPPSLFKTQGSPV